MLLANSGGVSNTLARPWRGSNQALSTVLLRNAPGADGRPVLPCSEQVDVCARHGRPARVESLAVPGAREPDLRDARVPVQRGAAHRRCKDMDVLRFRLRCINYMRRAD